MRRQDREHSDMPFMEYVLQRAQELFLALNTDAFPYVIPVNFVYEPGIVWVHCAVEGTKLELVARDARVGFSTAVDVHVDREHYSTHYRSICGTGTARIITDNAGKVSALGALAAKYQANCPQPIPVKMLDRITLLRIDVVSLTGKACGPAPV